MKTVPNLRNTKQRQVILEELRQLKSHPTAAELYHIVRNHLPKISLGTVYRNLELLTEMGAIQKIEMAGKEARFDANTGRHFHVRCIHCSRVSDMGSPPPNEVENDFKGMGWRILEQRVEYVGICPVCLREDKS